MAGNKFQNAINARDKSNNTSKNSNEIDINQDKVGIELNHKESDVESKNNDKEIDKDKSNNQEERDISTNNKNIDDSQGNTGAGFNPDAYKEKQKKEKKSVGKGKTYYFSEDAIDLAEMVAEDIGVSPSKLITDMIVTTFESKYGSKLEEYRLKKSKIKSKRR